MSCLFQQDGSWRHRHFESSLAPEGKALEPPEPHPLTQKASSVSSAHLHLAVGLQQLGDGHLVLLQSPLHQLGAADVDRALHVRRIVLRKCSAVNHQQPARSSLDEARQPLDVHRASLRRPFLARHDVGEAGVVLQKWGGGQWMTRGR